MSLSKYRVKSRRVLRSSLAGFWAQVNQQGDGGCWLWTGEENNGYGNWGNKRAHRIAYELCWGSIPRGLVLDHRCFNTLCVNPWHLEPVTPAENSRRNVSRRRGPNPHRVHAPSTEIIYWPILRRWLPI